MYGHHRMSNRMKQGDRVLIIATNFDKGRWFGKRGIYDSCNVYHNIHVFGGSRMDPLLLCTDEIRLCVKTECLNCEWKYLCYTVR